MKNKLFLTALLALFIATVAVAQPMMAPGRMDCGKHRGMAMMADRPTIDPLGRCLMGIDLTDQQKKDVEKLALEHQKKMLEQHAKMVDLKSKMKLALTSDKPNIDDLAVKIGKLHEEKAKMKANHLRKMRDILTPDQRITFDRNILTIGGGHCKSRMGCGAGRMGCGMGPCGSSSADIKPNPQ
ncbi:MAG: periplasmic heavy metal sensor [Calditrichaeota bacterium]|nr:periplasmic heavy metal sensor [Calditrichota bacterium]